MFAKFKMKLDKEDLLVDYRGCGALDRKTMLETVKSTLDKYILEAGNLDAETIEHDWFPQIDAHVFLSHSYTDEDLVINFAGYLYEHYKIKSFVDSSVWGYADELLKRINKKYCMYRNQQGKLVYDVSKTNRSAAQVYLLLQGALAKMIDQCECLIFVNTPSSLNISDVSGNEKTSSPWIYSELLMANAFPARCLKEYRKDELFHYAIGEAMEYRVDLSAFKELEVGDFRKAQQISLFKDIPTEILNQLYRDKGIIKQEKKPDGR